MLKNTSVSGYNGPTEEEKKYLPVPKEEESCHQASAMAFLDPIHYLSLFERQ